MFINDKRLIQKIDSIWWRDLVTLDAIKGLEQNIFSDFYGCRLGDAINIMFVQSKWMEDQSLKDDFPKYFAQDVNTLISVAK